jgi:hypothetical protein
MLKCQGFVKKIVLGHYWGKYDSSSYTETETMQNEGFSETWVELKKKIFSIIYDLSVFANNSNTIVFQNFINSDRDGFMCQYWAKMSKLKIKNYKKTLIFII